MIFNLSSHNSIANKFIAELRNIHVQNDKMRFRKNMENLGQLLAYEISKTFYYENVDVETPLGIANVPLYKEEIILGSILRAGLPMHYGMLDYFDDASNAFIAAYRHHHKNGTFNIRMEYISSPNLDDKILILCDPMIATGASVTLCLSQMLEFGTPKEIHVASIIASTEGLNHIQRLYPNVKIWVGAEDEELTAKSYIVPGLGDAGDLAFGPKIQD